MLKSKKAWGRRKENCELNLFVTTSPDEILNHFYILKDYWEKANREKSL